MKQTDDVKNLSPQESIAKFKELVDHESTCHFVTRLTEIPFTTRPMGVRKVCDQGNFWFLSGAESNKNQEIQHDSRVQLLFGNSSNYEYLTIFGHATVTRDRQKIDELWTDIAKSWFPGGKDDPSVTVIKVTPESGFYWDTKDGKLVSMVKFMVSAITGKTVEEGVQGTVVL